MNFELHDVTLNCTYDIHQLVRPTCTSAYAGEYAQKLEESGGMQPQEIFFEFDAVR